MGGAKKEGTCRETGRKKLWKYPLDNELLLWITRRSLQLVVGLVVVLLVLLMVMVMVDFGTQ